MRQGLAPGIPPSNIVGLTQEERVIERVNLGIYSGGAEFEFQSGYQLYSYFSGFSQFVQANTDTEPRLPHSHLLFRSLFVCHLALCSLDTKAVFKHPTTNI
jgi:hypothetical protein